MCYMDSSFLIYLLQFYFMDVYVCVVKLSNHLIVWDIATPTEVISEGRSKILFDCGFNFILGVSISVDVTLVQDLGLVEYYGQFGNIMRSIYF